MKEFKYGQYNRDKSGSPFEDSTYVQIINEQEARKQLGFPLAELATFLNGIKSISASGDIIQLRINEDNTISYRNYDNETWISIGDGNLPPVDDVMSDTSTNAVQNKVIKEYVDKAVNKVTVGTLLAGSNNITLTDESIDEDSILSFYTSAYGVNPTNVVVGTGYVTLLFEPQIADINVAVKVDGNLKGV